jgi:CRP-like cAMP-binding protein
MVEASQLHFPRCVTAGFLREHGEVALRVAEQLSGNYYSAYEEIRTLGLTSSPAEKLAKLLRSWSASAEQTSSPTKLILMLTHAEIAEMIGTTRGDGQPPVFGH